MFHLKSSVDALWVRNTHHLSNNYAANLCPIKHMFSIPFEGRYTCILSHYFQNMLRQLGSNFEPLRGHLLICCGGHIRVNTWTYRSIPWRCMWVGHLHRSRTSNRNNSPCRKPNHVLFRRWQFQKNCFRWTSLISSFSLHPSKRCGAMWFIVFPRK